MGDGKIHFSPAWDFDLSYNNFPTMRINSDGNIGYSYKPDNLFAACFPIHGYEDGGQTSSSGSGRMAAGRSWIGQLYQNPDFVKRAAELYTEHFEPFLNSLTQGDSPYLRELAEQIRPSAEMSNARWHTYGGAKYCVFGSSSGATFMDSVEIVRDYIERRKNWLSDLWMPLTYLRGDVNADGLFDTVDLILLQKWLLGVPRVKLPHWQAADFDGDDCLDVFDLGLMKHELLYR